MHAQDIQKWMAQVKKVLSTFHREEANVISVLQKVQDKLGYLSEEAIGEISHFLGLSKNEVYGVATFYSQFRFAYQGRHVIKVCLGTACHVTGGARILETVERLFDIHCGGVTKDGRFGLMRVACFGACALAPVMVVDNDLYSRVTPAKVKQILSKYE